MVTVGGLLAFATVSAQQQPLISYVRPLVGTSGYGNTYPGHKFLSEVFRSARIRMPIITMRQPDINTIIKRCWVLA